MIIIILLSLIFLIPTSGLSIVGLVLYLLLKFYTKHSKIERAIVLVGSNSGGMLSGSVVGNILYNDVLAYAQGLEQITKVQGEMVSFETQIKGVDYAVDLTREPLGTRAIFRVTII